MRPGQMIVKWHYNTWLYLVCPLCQGEVILGKKPTVEQINEATRLHSITKKHKTFVEVS